MNRKTIYSTHIGAASIMLIFMVLSLISFAALTFVNSRADFVLSEKMMDRSISYYKACHEANAFIAEVSTALREEYDKTPRGKDYTKMLEQTTFSKSIFLNQMQTLDITINAHSPEYEDDDIYIITSYRVVTHDENVVLDESLPVLK